MKKPESVEVERRARRVVDLFNLWRFDGIRAEIQDGGSAGRIVVRVLDTAGAGREYLSHECGDLAARALLEGLHVSVGLGGDGWFGVEIW